MRRPPEPPAAAGPRWRGWENAEQYDDFVREHDVYRWLNAELVSVAELADSVRVLDLGCGTGATTRTALGAIPVEGEVIGVDGSPEMVAVARANTVDPRASFEVASAEAVEQVVGGSFDGVLSNAAFWQFPRPDLVWQALGRLVRPGATLTFNVPGERREGAGPSHAFQIALARAIEKRAGHLFQPTATRFRPDTAAVLATEAGFEEELREVRAWEGRQAELIELMRIPAMRDPIASGLAPEAVLAAVDEAGERVDPDERVTVEWVFLRYRRR